MCYTVSTWALLAAAERCGGGVSSLTVMSCHNHHHYEQLQQNDEHTHTHPHNQSCMFLETFVIHIWVILEVHVSVLPQLKTFTDFPLQLLLSRGFTGSTSIFPIPLSEHTFGKEERAFHCEDLCKIQLPSGLCHKSNNPTKFQLQ